jgi:hypothetical protein
MIRGTLAVPRYYQEHGAAAALALDVASDASIQQLAHELKTRDIRYRYRYIVKGEIPQDQNTSVAWIFGGDYRQCPIAVLFRICIDFYADPHPAF